MDGGATEIVGEGSVPGLGSLERWWNDPSIAVWSFVLFGCFLLNATLLLAFLIRSGLRTISNRFVMNLAVSNLLTCAILNPLLIMDAPAASVTSSEFVSTSAGSICAISEGATALVTTSSVLSVLLIAMDQYFAVVDPLRYRTRVDKLKSGILIVSVWLISLAFSLIAFFNPNPRSLWLSCVLGDNVTIQNATLNSSSDAITESTFVLFENETAALEEIDKMTGILRTIESIKIDTSIGLMENTTVIFQTLKNDSITYGLIYAVVHSVFAYLLPFAAVCWIYVSIYAAAHRNSERTRRTGSRPILASASFCEEQNGLSRQQPMIETVEDFRRIPKISSLSSIDETSETTQPTNQMSRRRSFSSSSDVGAPVAPGNDENGSSGVVFTVGSQRVEVSPQRDLGEDDDDRSGRVAVATLKAEFLEKNRKSSTYEDLVRSKFRDRPDQRRKSSHDLMYEEMLARENARNAWISGGSTDGSSDSDEEDQEQEEEEEEEPRLDCFDTLDVPNRISKTVASLPKKKYHSPYCDQQNALNLEDASTLSEILEHSDEAIERESVARVNESSSQLQRREEQLAAQDKADPEDRHGKSSILRNPSEGRTSRRSSTTFAVADIILNPSESSGTVCNKNGHHGSSTCSNTSSSEQSSCLLAPIVTITPAPNKNGALHRVSSVRSTSSYINSLKYRISNGSIFRYREETRAARISALVIVMGLICWSPYVILSVLKNLPQYSDQYLPHEYDVLALSFLILAAYISPLLFGYRSRRVKRELRKFFCFKRELSYKNNRSLMAKKVLKRRHSSTLSHLELDHKYNIFNCMYGRSRWPKEKVQFVQVPDTALVVETCRSSFSSGASTQISSTSTEEC